MPFFRIFNVYSADLSKSLIDEANLEASIEPDIEELCECEKKLTVINDDKSK